MSSCPDYAFALKQIRVVTLDGDLSQERLAMELAARRLKAEPLGLEWTVELLGGAEQSGWLDEHELGELSELIEGARERVRREGPTMLATDLKAAVRELVDRSVAAQLH